MTTSKYRNINFNRTTHLVQSKLANYQSRRITKKGVILSAVLILFLNKKNIPHIIFTKRTESVENHKGQVSFPGGVQDSSDNSLLHTAERETFEEIGIYPENIKVLGRLDDFFTVTNYIVSPFTGFVQSPIEYKINEKEVAEVLEVPLTLFLEDNHFEVKKWDYRGIKYDVYFYYYKNSC